MLGERRWRLVGVVVALLATLPAWVRWLDPRLNLWGLDDAKNHLLRLYVLGWLVQHGVWHPRWAPDLFLGYGYPLFNFYAPGFYYLALALGTVLRLDVWDAYRAAAAAAALLAAAGAYALTVALWRRVVLGILAALTLLYGPYVFQINLFKRGDAPEALALALVPWLLFAVWQLWRARTSGSTAAWMGTAALTGAAVILAHNLTALLAGAIAAVWTIYLLVVRPDWRRLLRVAYAGLLAVGLTAFFWLPAVGESHAVQLEWLKWSGGLDYRGWFIEPNGNSDRQSKPENRQTRVGLIDLNLHYPHQLVAPPKISLAQAGLGALAAVSLAVGLIRRGARPAARPPGGQIAGADRANEAVATYAGMPLLLFGGACWYLTFAPSDVVWR